MSIKNFVLVLAAAGAFAGAIFIAAGPEHRPLQYAMPIYKAPK